MKHDKELIGLKLIAVVATMVYLYRLYQKNGQSLAGKYNPDQIANLASQLVPMGYRNEARRFGTAFLNKVIQ